MSVRIAGFAYRPVYGFFGELEGAPKIDTTTPWWLFPGLMVRKDSSPDATPGPPKFSPPPALDSVLVYVGTVMSTMGKVSYWADPQTQTLKRNGAAQLRHTRSPAPSHWTEAECQGWAFMRWESTGWCMQPHPAWLAKLVAELDTMRQADAIQFSARHNLSTCKTLDALKQLTLGELDAAGVVPRVTDAELDDAWLSTRTAALDNLLAEHNDV